MLLGEHLTLTFQDGESTVNAVNDVSIAIEKHQFVGILGPSGSGKSSLLYLLSGLRKATQGEVFLDDRAYSNLIEDGSCNADFSGDPMLGPLADNGGGISTHSLLPGSPAIDAIPAILCTLPTDQRGALRPIAQISPDTPCDIGAFELQIE